MRSRKHDAGVSVITLVSMVGVTVGVTALIMVLAVMEGFEIDLRQKILGSNAHVVVRSVDHSHFTDYEEMVQFLAEQDGVESSAPFIFTEVVVKSESQVAWVYLNGVDIERSGKVQRMVGELVEGPQGTLDDDATESERWDVLRQLPRQDLGEGADPYDARLLPGIILGEDLADGLLVDVDDIVEVINPSATPVTRFGVRGGDSIRFRVAGVFDSGMYEYDTKWSYVAMEDAQMLVSLGTYVSGDVASGIEVMASDVRDADALARELEGKVAARSPYLKVDSWEQMNQSLFSALKLEKIAMGLILSLIVVVASLNIVGSLILVVVTRAREISIMRAMGASSLAVRTVFMMEGLVIGVVGTVLGTALGLAGCWGLARYEFPLDTDVYYLDTLPVVIEPVTVATVALSALLISFVATLYPAGLASRLDPVEGLRYE
jgi:lipoprotein-releasing system permease protein